MNRILKFESIKNKVTKRKPVTRRSSRVALNDFFSINASNREISINTTASSYLEKSLDAPRLPDFRSFISNEDNIDLFKDFLKSQFCQENIDFYVACDRFQKLDADDELISFMANQIFNAYLSDNAKQPVNLSHDCLKRIKDRIDSPDTYLFSEAQHEIFELMRTDCYPRFCKTWMVDHETALKISQRTQVCKKNSMRRSICDTAQVRRTRSCRRRSPPAPPLPPKPKKQTVEVQYH